MTHTIPAAVLNFALDPKNLISGQLSGLRFPGLLDLSLTPDVETPSGSFAMASPDPGGLLVFWFWFSPKSLILPAAQALVIKIIFLSCLIQDFRGETNLFPINMW